MEHAITRPGIDRCFVGAVAALILLQIGGIGFVGPGVTTAACAAMLVFGLPHGTLDLELIARQRRAPTRSAPAVLALYLGLAGATYLLWRVEPVVALAAFVIVAAIHFAEDWSAVGSAFLAQGMGLAILAAPSVLWRDEVRALFVAVAGDPSAGHLADLLLIVAPLSLIVGAVALVSLWVDRRRGEALAGAAVIAAMIVLPPALGFALFFCLFHSPLHFRDAVQALARPRFAQWRSVVLPLTGIALAGAIALVLVDLRGPTSASVIAASFMTLSILTVPHMLVPIIVAALDRRRSRDGASRLRHAVRTIG